MIIPCNQLDLETLGSQPIMLKNLPGQCGGLNKKLSILVH